MVFLPERFTGKVCLTYLEVDLAAFSLYEYFTGDDSSSGKYENLYSFVLVDGRWKTLVDNNAHGQVNRGAVFRIGGEGISRVEWCTKLDRTGWYEVFVYVPKWVYQGNRDAAGHADAGFSSRE